MRGFTRPLGYRMAAFILDSRPRRLQAHDAFVTLTCPKRQVTVYPIRGGRLATVFLHPGSLLATALWMASSFAFKFYVTSLGNFNATYGAIGGVVVLLLWFYVSGLAILVGAELNGVIEQAVPATVPTTRSRPETSARHKM